MLDGQECPELYWFVNCAGAPYNPFDPTDDVLNNDVVFYANNTSGVVDLNLEHRWRTITNDFYTGSTYAHIDSVHPSRNLTVPVTNLTHLAPTSFANSTVEWDFKFTQPLTAGPIPAPSYYSNVSETCRMSVYSSMRIMRRNRCT